MFLGIHLRYWRIGLMTALVYGVLILGIGALRGKLGSFPWSAFVVIGVVSVAMPAFLAILERRSLKRLGLDEDSAYDENVFAPTQAKQFALDDAPDRVLTRAEEALVEYGAVIESVDRTKGSRKIVARTSQNWRSYGETIVVKVGDDSPTSIDIRINPRLWLLGALTNYGRSWELVHAIAARMQPGSAPRPVTVGRSAICAGGVDSAPPSILEAGAWQRLLTLASLYALILMGGVRPGKMSAVLVAMSLGLLVEFVAFLYFRAQVATKSRSETQENIEALLNNLWPATFAPVMLMDPTASAFEGNNIAAIMIFCVFVMIGINRWNEKKRERAQRATILASRENAELKRQLAEAKLVALSAQIEPHFLFNTLASIQYLIRHDSEKATHMTSDLIRYLRLALPRMKQSTARLADELDLVRAYLGIMQIRMGARLQFDIAEPHSLADVDIPTMALITLVENAIKHGLERKPGGGEIRITVAQQGNTLTLAVIDTGGGFSTESSGTGIGLMNIRERLATLYGAQGNLSLEANEPSGVKATISLPLTQAAMRSI